ncbi:hypothetical protein BG004_005292, partial [Podila humilis]
MPIQAPATTAASTTVATTTSRLSNTLPVSRDTCTTRPRSTDKSIQKRTMPFTNGTSNATNGAVSNGTSNGTTNGAVTNGTTNGVVANGSSSGLHHTLHTNGKTLSQQHLPQVPLPLPPQPQQQPQQQQQQQQQQQLLPRKRTLSHSTPTLVPSSTPAPPPPSPSPSRARRRHQHKRPISQFVQPLVIPTTTANAQAEAIRTHSYWSGFYKKTIKERRTQLGLAFPYLAKPSSLENFASTQNSARTSGESTPQSSIWASMPMSMPTPTPLHRRSSTNNFNVSVNGNSNNVFVHPLSSTSTMTTARSTITQSGVVNPTGIDDVAPSTTTAVEKTTSSTTPTLTLTSGSKRDLDSVIVRSPEEKSLLNYTEEEEVIPIVREIRMEEDDDEADKDGKKEEKDPLFDQEDEAMTEEERREQLEKERTATVISDLTEQRRMIGSPNGSLLEGDLSLDARLDALIATEQEGTPFPVHGLDEEIANNMIENCIGTLGLPMGLAFNFTINGAPLVIPMAIEEPSVIAAVSSAAKTISGYKGFQAWAPERNMIVAQVQLLDILDSAMDQVVERLEELESSIRDEANEYCTNMVLRGGGVQRVTLHRIRRQTKRESFRGQDLLVKHGVIPPHKVQKREEASSSSSSLPKTSSFDQCSEWLIVHLHIDVGDAMGANCANTVAEGIAPYLAKLSGGRVGVRILSNLNSTFRLPFSHMGYKSLSGKDVAVRMLEAFEWADLDPYRATTHNKGIMNGIDAVALATGQDWRAIEAGAHAWASGAGMYSERSSSSKSSSFASQNLKTGSKRKFAEVEEKNTGELVSPSASLSSPSPSSSPSSSSSVSSSERIHRGDAYKSLTRYWIEEDPDRIAEGYTGQESLVFCGELEMPIMVGTKGGVLSTNPVHAFTLGIMKYPDSKLLAMAMVTTGLAQNFAALRALVTEGIQRGHMALHARNIAISAGTPPVSVDEVTAYMIDSGKIRLGAARSYLAARGLGIYSQSSSSSSSVSSSSSSLLTNGSGVGPDSVPSRRAPA